MWPPRSQMGSTALAFSEILFRSLLRAVSSPGRLATMITFNLTCIAFMDSDPAAYDPVTVELAVTPRFSVRPHDLPAGSDAT